jgi:regulator of sirC expression with transglutaminase-like and TPR domain
MDPALAAFGRAVCGPDGGIDLARAALLIAEVEHPALPIDDYLDALGRLAARSGAARAGDPVERLHLLREFLFEEEGFRGNTEDYYDPRNSCLNDVLDRKLGIPITLALVLIEVGRRVGLTVEGIGLPGHFVVRAAVDQAPMLLDPFNGGTILTHQACAELVAGALGRRVALRDEHFVPVTKRQFLVRMLNNLKTVYWHREDWCRALAMTDRLLAVEPTSMTDVRDRGTLLNKLGDVARGLADWERYLAECPAAPDAESLRGHLRRARLQLASLN